MTLFRITVAGCDDENSIDMDLTPVEMDLVTRLADLLTEASTGSCMPVMTVERNYADTTQEPDPWH